MHPTMAPPREISAFERKRLENIAENRTILADIAASAATTKLAAPKPASTPKSASRPSRKSRPSSATPTAAAARPTRQSSRIAGLSADNDTLKRRLSEDTAAERERERAKRTRVNGDLVLGDIALSGTKWDGGVGGLKSLQVRGAQPGVPTWDKDGVKEESDGGGDGGGDGVKALRNRLGKLELYDKWVPNGTCYGGLGGLGLNMNPTGSGYGKNGCQRHFTDETILQDLKITPQRVYALGFHPTEDKPILFAGDKEGAMGVFDASQVKEEADEEDADDAIPIMSVFKSHARTISAFAFSPTDSNAVYSASYDSSIRKVDLAKGISTQVYAPADPTAEQAVSGVEMPEMEPNMVYFSTLDGDFGRHDIRAPSGKAKLWSLSEQKIGGFTLHPRHSHLVATASLDRTMKIWDLRKIVDAAPSLVGAHESRLSVSHAAWSAAGHIATTSYDDTIKIYSFGRDGPAAWTPGVQLTEAEMGPAVVVPHNNQTGRWVTILKPQWQRRRPDEDTGAVTQRFVVANMNRFVDVFAADGTQVAQLGGDGITAVPAVAQFHPTVDWVAGGTGSGKLCLWV